MEHESNTIREQIEEQVEARAEVLRQLSKVNSEIQLWRTKFESEGLAKTEELEDSKFVSLLLTMGRIVLQLLTIKEENNDANPRSYRAVRIGQSENSVDREGQTSSSCRAGRRPGRCWKSENNTRSNGAMENLRSKLFPQAHNFSNQLEKKQKGFDKITDEWKRKFDDLKAELEASQRDNRNLATEVLSLFYLIMRRISIQLWHICFRPLNWRVAMRKFANSLRLSSVRTNRSARRSKIWATS